MQILTGFSTRQQSIRFSSSAGWQSRRCQVHLAHPHSGRIWPLVANATHNREIPVVGRGIGPGGLAFSLLGRRYGAPWIYAALELGMETFTGEATVTKLEDEYSWPDINRQMRFVRIVGQGAAENAAFTECDSPASHYRWKPSATV